MGARNNISYTLAGKNRAINSLSASPQSKVAAWFRNPSWLALPSVTAADNKFVGLVKITNSSANFVALTAAGAYTIDWGDGSATENIATGAKATHNYSWASAGLNNTSGEVTFQDSGDTVTRTSHGYQDGMAITFATIVTTTGISVGQTYYVVNATTNTFQVSLTYGGAAVALTTNGSGTLLPYKQAIITVTMQNGQTFTSINLQQVYTTGTYYSRLNLNWLDIVIAGSALTTITISASSTALRLAYLEQIQILASAITTFANIFESCHNLRNVPYIKSTGVVTTTTAMFYKCYQLQSVGSLIFNSPTNTTSMFAYCQSLITAPYFDTSAVTNMYNMFGYCTSLVNVPSYNMTGCNSTGSFNGTMNMFQYCGSLVNAPWFDMTNVKTMGYMFYFCYSLQYVPNYNTSGVTNMSYIFANCSSLQVAPTLDYTAATNVNSLFLGTGLRTIGDLSFPAATDVANLFNTCPQLASIGNITLKASGTITSSYLTYNCASLEKMPTFSRSDAFTDLTWWCYNCWSLSGAMPTLNCTNVTAFATFVNAYAINDISGMTNVGRAFDISGLSLTKAQIETFTTNGLATLGTTYTFTVTACLGTDTAIAPTITATAKALTATVSSATGLTNGMILSPSSVSGYATPVTFAADITADTLTLNGHNFSNGQKISFATLGTITGVSINTIYFIVNKTVNTFQIALTAGGAAINLTGVNSNVTMRWVNYITNIAGTTITFDAPMGASGTGVASSFRLLDLSVAIHKGWTLAY